MVPRQRGRRRRFCGSSNPSASSGAAARRPGRAGRRRRHPQAGDVERERRRRRARARSSPVPPAITTWAPSLSAPSAARAGRRRRATSRTARRPRRRAARSRRAPGRRTGRRPRRSADLGALRISSCSSGRTSRPRRPGNAELATCWGARRPGPGRLRGHRAPLDRVHAGYWRSSSRANDPAARQIRRSPERWQTSPARDLLSMWSPGRRARLGSRTSTTCRVEAADRRVRRTGRRRGGLRGWVARGLREVEQRRECVEAADEDAQARGEAVQREPHRAVAAAGRGRRGGGYAKCPPVVLGEDQQVGWSSFAAARARADRRCLRTARSPTTARPLRSLEVLDEDAGPVRRRGQQRREEARRRARSGARSPAAKSASAWPHAPFTAAGNRSPWRYWNTSSLPGDETRAARARAGSGLQRRPTGAVLVRRPGRGRAVGRPTTGVALERQEHRGHARRRQVAALGDLRRDRHAGHLAPPHAAEAVADASRLGEHLPVLRALRAAARPPPRPAGRPRAAGRARPRRAPRAPPEAGPRAGL